MACKIIYSAVCGLQLECIYPLAIVTVLMMGADMSVQVAGLRAIVKFDSESENAGVNDQQNFSNASDMRRYSHTSTESAIQEANLTTVLSSHSTDVSVVIMGNHGIESNRKQTTNRTLTDLWGTFYNLIESVLRNCYYEYSPETIPYETEKRFVKCLQQEAIREVQSILNYDGSNGLLRSQENGDYRLGKMDQLPDTDRTSPNVNLRVKLMSGLFFWLSQREESLRVGMELDERDISRLEGRGKDRKELKKLKKFLSLLLIPIALQFLLLPMVLGTLKMMATKALIAAKIALLLVVFNAAWTALMPQRMEHNTRVASEQYGYDGALEYGAYINKRAFEYEGQT